MSESRKSHAVVLGASMAGMGAARALSGHFDRVTLVERDVLPAGVESRKGVPQGNHTHGLLPSGYRLLDSYFPRMMDELEAEGVPRVDPTGDFLWYQYGRWKLRTDSGLAAICISRPCLDRKVRERVRALPNVTVLDGHDAVEPVFDFDSNRVTGLAVRDRKSGEASTLRADLVVDASGRGSQSPKWLASWGFGQVPETNVRVDVGYATATFERRPGELHGAFGAIIAGVPPASKRYAVALAVEGDRWIITLAGLLEDYPPTELAAWREYARSLPVPELVDLVADRQPLGPIVSYRFSANRRRHFEKLPRFPEGYLVMGDAACSLNPIYAQGMSVALNEVRALDECLERGQRHLARRFFRRVKAATAGAWDIATGEDYRYPEIQGKRPVGFGFIKRYLNRVHRACARDQVVLQRFCEVTSLLAPPASMMSPAIVWRVLLGGIGPRLGTPAHKLAAARDRPRLGPA